MWSASLPGDVFGLGVYLSAERGASLSTSLAVAFFVVSMVFVYRSFYGMRIETR